MPFFRKKPVVIEAEQLTRERIDACVLDGAPLPSGAVMMSNHCHMGRREVYSARVVVKTLEGVMEASPGDWIIRGVRGEFYPCRPDIFAATYEPAPVSPGASTGATTEGKE
jgi:hypothetical protein